MPLIYLSTYFPSAAPMPSEASALNTWGTDPLWPANGGQLAINQVADNSRSSPVAAVFFPGQAGSGLIKTASIGGRYNGSAYVGHGAAIRDDGRLFTWGINSHGQLGVNSPTTQSYNALRRNVSTASWAVVACGVSHTAGIRTDGTLWMWGSGGNGALGDGTTVNKSSPVQITGTWSAVSCGDNFTTAIKPDGTLWAWGRNNDGQLGDGTTVSKSSPVQIGAETNWMTLAKTQGSNTTAAIRTDGTLWMMGVVPIGSTTPSINYTIVDTPGVGGFRITGDRRHALPPGTTFDVTGSTGNDGTYTVSSSSYPLDDFYSGTSCGLIYTTLFTSPAPPNDPNAGAQGTITNVLSHRGSGVSSPVQIGGSWTVVALSQASNWVPLVPSTGLGIQTDGSLWSWGSNQHGQCGDGNRVTLLAPAQISTDVWLDVAVGSVHSLAIKSNWTLWSWGTNNFAACQGGPVAHAPFGLGDAGLKIDQRSSPVQAVAASYRSVLATEAANLVLEF